MRLQVCVPSGVRARTLRLERTTCGVVLIHCRQRRGLHATYVRSEDLELTKDRMREQYTNCRFPNEPVTPKDVQR